MRTITALLILLFSFSLSAITITVSQDGTEDYTTIQSAINSSNNYDLILVHPGRYIENINLNNHNVTIASLYYVDQNPTHIDSTIIDGNLFISIFIVNGETVTLNGFTISNNIDNLNVQIAGNTYGGGVRIRNNSNVTILNSKIKNCIGVDGAGVKIDESDVIMTNVEIRNNRALYRGGGIYLYSGATLSTSNVSIYNNIAPIGMDLFFLEYNDVAGQFNFNFQLGSIALTGIDNFFASINDSDNVTLTISNSYFNIIDSDVYVSPTGDDNNDGLTAATPLQSIHLALQLVADNPANPHTVYLDSGTYSFSQNNQLLPCAVKPNVSIEGAGMENTIIDGEMANLFFGGWQVTNSKISDIRFENGRSNTLMYPIYFSRSTNIVLRNLIIDNTVSHGNSGFRISTSNNVMIENSIIQNVSSNNDYLMTLTANYSENIFINNLISRNINLLSADYSYAGLYFNESDVIVRNTIITDCSGSDACLFAYQCIDTQYANRDLKMSNVLIYNNNANTGGWTFAPVYIQDRYDPIKMSNCTFANNTTNNVFVMILAYAEVSNCIFYNPNVSSDISFHNYFYSTQNQDWINGTVLVQNSLFLRPSFTITEPTLMTEMNNLYSADPVFLGTTTDTLVFTQPEYYQLSEFSPCRDAGTQDTTGLYLPPTDLAGIPRIWNNIVDIGAYEYPYDPVSIDESEPVPANGISLVNFPNPINLNGKGAYSFIEFSLPNKPVISPVIEIFNIRGQKVQTIDMSVSLSQLARTAGLSTANKQNGEVYSTVWNCRNQQNKEVGSGVYFYQVKTDKVLGSGKMLILK